MGSAGCAGGGVPDPKDAVRAYADAAARGDADALYDMMSDEARRSVSRDEVKRMVAGSKGELAAHAKAFTDPNATLKARADLRFADGELASLSLDDDGAFRVTSADGVPMGARTPQQALEQLRRVLARRSYAGLMRVLTPQTRSAIEADLRALVEGLESPAGLEVQVSGDRATVTVPGGHFVRLRREAGVWLVEDFD